MHKLRRAMVRPHRDRLAGRVELDEAYVGGVYPGRLGRIPDASGQTLMGFVRDAVEAGSLVYTDGWMGYEPLRRHGYKHRVTFLEGQARSPSQLMPHVYQVVSLLKR